MKETLMQIWLWTVAVLVTVIMAATAMAWVGGLALFVVRWING